MLIVGYSRTFGAPAGTTPLPNSLDFEAGESDGMSRTFASGDVNKWTLSMWVKRESASGGEIILFAAESGVDSTNHSLIGFFNSALIHRVNGPSNANGGFLTSTTYTSTSDWYHILLAVDSAQSGSDKVRIKVNNVTPSFSSDSRSSWAGGSEINTACGHTLGIRPVFGGQLFDGLMADVIFLNGEYLDASDFGQDVGGTWSRKNPPSPASGTNSFRLDGSGSVGDDAYGSNDWTNSGVTHSATVPPEV